MRRRYEYSEALLKRISSSAKYFYTKTVLNYNLEYANFETTQVSNCNLDFTVICLAEDCFSLSSSFKIFCVTFRAT